MPLELSIMYAGSLPCRPGLPPGFHGPVLPGADSFNIRSPLASVVLQELKEEHYTIRLFIGNLLKRIYAQGWESVRGLSSMFMLKNGIRNRLDVIGRMHVREGQHASFFSSNGVRDFHSEKDQEIQGLDIYFAPSLVSELISIYPELQSAIESAETISILRKTYWTTATMRETVNQILSCPYQENTRRFFLDIKVRELLFHVLEQAYSQKPERYSFSTWERARIQQARNILLGFISKKPPTTKWLAKEVGLNEFKLKAGFRQYFNSGIFTWLMDQKMLFAKELINNTNKPIKEIAAMVGYPLTTNFITAFRKKHGIAPGALRRK